MAARLGRSRGHHARCKRAGDAAPASGDQATGSSKPVAEAWAEPARLQRSKSVERSRAPDHLTESARPAWRCTVEDRMCLACLAGPSYACAVAGTGTCQPFRKEGLGPDQAQGVPLKSPPFPPFSLGPRPGGRGPILYHNADVNMMAGTLLCASIALKVARSPVLISLHCLRYCVAIALSSPASS